MFRKLMSCSFEWLTWFLKVSCFLYPLWSNSGFPPNFYAPLIQSKMKSAQNVHILYDNFNVYKKRSVEWKILSSQFTKLIQFVLLYTCISTNPSLYKCFKLFLKYWKLEIRIIAFEMNVHVKLCSSKS